MSGRYRTAVTAGALSGLLIGFMLRMSWGHPDAPAADDPSASRPPEGSATQSPPSTPEARLPAEQLSAALVGSADERWRENLDPASPLAILALRGTGKSPGVMDDVLRRRSELMSTPESPEATLARDVIGEVLATHTHGRSIKMWPVICRAAGCEIQVIDQAARSRSSSGQPGWNSEVRRLLKSGGTPLPPITVDTLVTTVGGEVAYISYVTFR